MSWLKTELQKELQLGSTSDGTGPCIGVGSRISHMVFGGPELQQATLIGLLSHCGCSERHSEHLGFS